jgi:hypothetical protein
MSLPPSVTLGGTNPVISHVSGRVSYANGNGRWNSTDRPVLSGNRGGPSCWAEVWNFLADGSHSKWPANSRPANSRADTAIAHRPPAMRIFAQRLLPPLRLPLASPRSQRGDPHIPQIRRRSLAMLPHWSFPLPIVMTWYRRFRSTSSLTSCDDVEFPRGILVRSFHSVRF